MSQHKLLMPMGAVDPPVHRQLDLVHRQIALRAERLTVTEKTKARAPRRFRSSRTRANAKSYNEHLDRLTFERRTQIDALTFDLTETTI